VAVDATLRRILSLPLSASTKKKIKLSEVCYVCSGRLNRDSRMLKIDTERVNTVIFFCEPECFRLFKFGFETNKEEPDIVY